MLYQPMSSPMIMMMLGFGCATAGLVVHVSATRSAPTAARILRMLSSILLGEFRAQLGGCDRLALSPSTVSASQQQLDVWRRADNGGSRRAEGPQGSYACRVRRPQLGQIQPKRTGAPADDPLELADGLALQPTFETDDADAR